MIIKTIIMNVFVSQAVACVADIKSIMPHVCCTITGSYKALY